jgi:enoyl-[acyl-carrier-protein] reductase (NADH)
MNRLLEQTGQRDFVDSHTAMPFGYHLKPEDVAQTHLWLTDESNNHITGQTVFSDGGAEAILRADRTF